MAEFSHLWSAQSAVNMHSSNPEPFSWDELSTLTQLDLSTLLSQSSFSYESTQGCIKVREGLAEHCYQNTHVDQITLTSGAQEGLFVLMNSLLTVGDEVISLTPCFEPLIHIAQSLGAEVNSLALDADDNWAIPWQQLEQMVTPKTKLLVINFPHNPTGKHITQAELDRLINLCDQAGCWLLSDEVFRGLEHDPSMQLPAVVDVYAQGISMGVMSKATALPGIRVGWLAMQDKNLLDRCLTVKSHLSICQSSLDARMCELLLPFSQKIHHRSVAVINHNKTLVADMLNGHTGLSFNESHGSATAFIKLLHMDALEFCQNMVKLNGIFVMPNQAFLTDQPGFRMTLGKKQSTEFFATIFSQD